MLHWVSLLLRYCLHSSASLLLIFLRDIVWPVIAEKARQEIGTLSQNGAEIIVIEAAVLIEVASSSYLFAALFTLPRLSSPESGLELRQS